MLNFPALYRKRFIPQETVHLKDDVILQYSDQLIITKWNTLKPRQDISHGVSAYFIENGFKISKVYASNAVLVHWYCDIIHVIHDLVNHSIIFEDLLIDIILDKDNSVRVVDLGELADAHEQGLISGELLYKALHTTNSLLDIIYRGQFHKYQAVIDQLESLPAFEHAYSIQ